MFVHGIGNITLRYFQNKSYVSTNGAIVCKKNYELTILLSILNAEKSQIKCEVTTVCDVDCRFDTRVAKKLYGHCPIKITNI